MQITGHLKKRLRQRVQVAWQRLRADQGAVAMIEAAITLPVLILLGFGGMELANMVLVHSRISQIGLSAADNASRIAAGSNLALPQVREVDINEVFTGAEHQARGLNLAERGRIILSSLETNDRNGQWIHWQRCYGNLPVDSTFGKEGDGKTGTSFPGMGPASREVKAPSGSAIMFIEIVYQYRPIIMPDLFGGQTIRSTAAFNIREARDLTKVYPFQGAKVSSCNR